MKAIEVTFVRHGQTLANVDRCIQGHQGGCITVKGELQAKNLGLYLANRKKYHVIISSDLNRTQQTTSIILRNNGYTLPVMLDNRLREKNGGVLEGSAIGMTEREAQKHGLTAREFRPEGGGENWDDVLSRAADFLNDWTENYDKLLKKCCVDIADDVEVVRLLVVSHGGFIKEVVNHVLNVRNTRNNFHNTSRTAVRLMKGKSPQLKFRDDTSHITNDELWKIVSEPSKVGPISEIGDVVETMSVA